MNCNMQQGKCTHCGGTSGGSCAVQPAPPRPLLGDRTERLLAGIGITDEWYVREIKQRFGLAPKCSCGIRKSYLNNVDAWFRQQVAGAGRALKK